MRINRRCLAGGVFVVVAFSLNEDAAVGLIPPPHLVVSAQNHQIRTEKISGISTRVYSLIKQLRDTPAGKVQQRQAIQDQMGELLDKAHALFEEQHALHWEINYLIGSDLQRNVGLIEQLIRGMEEFKSQPPIQQQLTRFRESSERREQAEGLEDASVQDLFDAVRRYREEGRES